MAEIALKEFIDAEQLRTDVSINITNLDDAMVNQAGLFVHYASMTIKARKQYERLKSTVEIIESKLYAQYRQQMIADGIKVTEAQIDNAIKTDKQWVGAQSKLIEAQSIWKMCEAAENALGMRKDMVLELARDRRKEREGELRVSELHEQRDKVIEMLREAKK